jgi:ABC-type phosphate transport system substrate-binding protein
MNRISAQRTLALAFLTIGLGSIPLPEAMSQNADPLVVVVSPSNSISKITLGDAKQLFLGETSTWNNGQKVVVVLKPPGNTERAAVLKEICGMSETIYTRHELQASFTGQTAASITVASSDAAVLATVKANPGAIAALPKSAVDASAKIVLTLE